MPFSLLNRPRDIPSAPSTLPSLLLRFPDALNAILRSRSRRQSAMKLAARLSWFRHHSAGRTFSGLGIAAHPAVSPLQSHLFQQGIKPHLLRGFTRFIRCP